jgi:tetratricopeptide (TPR) repeat protein
VKKFDSSFNKTFPLFHFLNFFTYKKVERTSIYCQNCRSQNSLRDTHCQNCGTRLLLVVFPNSLQYDTNHVPSFYEDHLLERVSLLELRLVQVSESLRIAMEIIREQGKIVKENHNLTKNLYQILGNLNIEEAEKIQQKWNELQSKDTKTKNKKSKNSQIIETIVAEHDSPNVELFTKLLNEGVKLLSKNEEKEAFRMLERAALLSPRNAPLLSFIAEKYFLADKFDDAKKYLEKAFEFAPDDPNILLLLGVIFADEGKAENARHFLSILAENENTSRVVNFIWGILAAFEGKWTESLAAFKLALGDNEIPELQYLIGCVYFNLSDEILALRHLQIAGSLDKNYSDACFMQAVIYHSQADFEREKNMLQNASEKPEAGAQCQEFLRKNKLNLENALPFQHFKKKNARLLTGGALRLARFCRSEIGKAIE